MKKVSLLLLVVTVGLVVCPKSQSALNMQSKSKKGFGSADIVRYKWVIIESPANPNNPYDYYGVLHNGIIEVTKPIWSDTNATTSDIYNAVSLSGLGTMDNPIPSLNQVASITNFVLANIDGNTNVMGKFRTTHHCRRRQPREPPTFHFDTS